MEQQRVLVISAHAVDFVWRCAGTIANYTAAGHRVKIICLTYGARGESDGVWKNNPGITEEEVIQRRRQEAQNAADCLGAEIEFYGWEDHLLTIDRDRMMRIAAEMKDFQPDIILSHSASDPLNADHDNAHRAVMEAMRSANVAGVFPEKKMLSPLRLYMFEPDQPDVCGYLPNVYIDISDTMEKKKQAMELVMSQNYIAPGYINRAEYRGFLAKRVLGQPVRYAEAFIQLMPHVGKTF